MKSTGPANVYPALPADQATACTRANVPVGLNAKAAWARSEQAFNRCSAKQARLVHWYNQLRRTRTP